MNTSIPISTLIQQRYSCRNYEPQPIETQAAQTITSYLSELPPGPFQKNSRFHLAASSENDPHALRGLGTYGFIKNTPAYIIGASTEGPLTLEDFGYRLEQIILFATSLGLGTCWLGGTFTRSGFAKKIEVQKDEIIPAVCALGLPAQENSVAGGKVQNAVASRNRLAWEQLFFENDFAHPLNASACGAYQLPLEMVHIAPSASNKQPWRILKQGALWHFYLQRTRGYRETALSRFTGIADMQRIDMGIALSHFALTAAECSLAGQWVFDEPAIEMPDNLTSYFITWQPE